MLNANGSRVTISHIVAKSHPADSIKPILNMAEPASITALMSCINVVSPVRYNHSNELHLNYSAYRASR